MAVAQRLAVRAAVVAHAQVVAQQPRRAAGPVDGERELLADLRRSRSSRASAASASPLRARTSSDLTAGTVTPSVLARSA